MNPRGATVGPEIGILAEIASCQLEYTYLAKETGKREYFDVVFAQTDWSNRKPC